MRLFFSLLMVFFFQNCFSQNVDFEKYSTQLNELGIVMDQPTEGRGKFLEPFKKSIVPHLFSVKFKNEDLEVWVNVKPFDSLNISTQMPHLEAGRIATNSATNDEEAVTTVLRLSDEFAAQTFGADWGREFYFQPKKQISERENCRLLSLYKEGVGQMNLLFFFDEKTKGLEYYYDMFRFEK